MTTISEKAEVTEEEAERLPLVDARLDQVEALKLAHRWLPPGRVWSAEVRWHEVEVPGTPEPEQLPAWREAQRELEEATAAVQAADDAACRARGARAVAHSEEKLAEAWRIGAEAEHAER